jgi:hypothetical protein
VNATNEPILSVVLSPALNLIMSLRNDLRECKSKQISEHCVTARIRRLGAKLTDRMKLLVEDIRTRTIVEVLQRRVNEL